MQHVLKQDVQSPSDILKTGLANQKTHKFGNPLLFEHLPHIKFRHSQEGVLFALFESGEAFFYPLNDQTKGNQPTSARMLTQEPSRKKTEISSISPKAQETNKVFVYDVSLSLNTDLYRVPNFRLEFTENSRPRKVLLSPNKQLLLVIGALYKNNSCLYQIVGNTTPPCFRLIFYDHSFTFIDACFSPDSRHLITISTRFPLYLLSLSLPLVPASLTPAPTSFLPSTTTLEELRAALELHEKERNEERREDTAGLLRYEARKAGALSVIGPARGLFGGPLKMTHIAANPNCRTAQESSSNDTGSTSCNSYANASKNTTPNTTTNNTTTNNTTTSNTTTSNTTTNNTTPNNNSSSAPSGASVWEYVTWNDDPLGEFALWAIDQRKRPASEDQSTEPARPKFRYQTRTVVYRQTEDDYDWSPRCQILNMQFSERDSKLAAMVKREHKSRKSENGIGLQMIGVSETESATAPKEVHWYQVSESSDASKILCFRWSNTLLIGNAPSAAVLIEGKGVFELVDFRFCSSFQDLYEMFVSEARMFVQVDRYNRFWLNSNGGLRVMVVTPQQPCPHPEWSEIEKAAKTDILNMRVWGKRIGYYINTVEKDSLDYFKKRGKDKLPDTTPQGLADQERFCGLHLYRCWFCKRLLLKPLQCSRCKSVVYCSKTCQKSHWIQIHRHECKGN